MRIPLVRYEITLWVGLFWEEHSTDRLNIHFSEAIARSDLLKKYMFALFKKKT